MDDKLVNLSYEIITSIKFKEYKKAAAHFQQLLSLEQVNEIKDI